MPPLVKVRSFLRNLFLSGRVELDLHEEVHAHLEMLVEQNIRAGMPPNEAQRAARIEVGGIEQLKEQVREERVGNWLRSVTSDSRYCVRQLRKNPAFTAVVVLSLALGIGANTAIFSLINAALLKMLPVAAPEQLVHLTVGSPDNVADDSFSYPTFKQLCDHNQVFSGVLAFRGLENLDFDVNDHAGLAKGQAVSGNYYSVLGVNTILGRTITPADDQVTGGGPVAVISYGYWTERFNRDPSAVGKAIVLNGSPFTLIGVTPPEFFGLEPGDSVDVSIPISMVAKVRPDWAATGTPYSVLSAPFRNWLHLMARLKSGVTEERALANSDAIFRQAMRIAAEGLVGLPFDSPRSRQMFLQTRLHLELGGRGLAALRQQFSKPLLILMAVVVLLLLIACANVANLMLVRASARQREIAVRVALGAGRLRLIRQLVTESIMLALAGGVGGLVLAFLASSGLLVLMSHSSSPISLNVQPDARVLGFTALVSLFTAILFGLVPAMRATQFDLGPGLKEGARNLGGVRRSSRLAKVLVISQVALSLVLLIGAGLLVRTLKKLKDFYPGFNAQHVLLISMNPSMVGYKEAQVVGLYQRLLTELKTLAGVQVVSLSDFSPLGVRFSSVVVTVEGYKPRPDENTFVMINVIGPDYFRVLETPVLLGREFTGSDEASAAKVAIINHTMAHNYFGDTNPIGRRISVPGWKGDASWLEIVGVVQDAKYHSLREQTPPQAYIPFFQSPETGAMTLEVRVTMDQGRAAATVRGAIQEIDTRLPVFDVKTLKGQVDESLVQERLIASLSTLFGLLALSLAAVGLYGLMAYAVARRTNEFGIRMALGAPQQSILRLVMKDVSIVLAGGATAGVCISLATVSVLQKMLFGLAPHDTFTFVAAISLLSAAAFFAGYLPARRAMRVDPMIALRYE
jgi:predicted permease